MINFVCVDSENESRSRSDTVCSHTVGCSSHSTTVVKKLPKVYDRLLWAPGFKLALDLPEFIIRNRSMYQKMRLALNCKTERKMDNGLERSITLWIIIPSPTGMHKSCFKIFISSKKDGELIHVTNFDVPVPIEDYFFVTVEGDDDILTVANFKGELSIVSCE